MTEVLRMYCKPRREIKEKLDSCFKCKWSLYSRRKNVGLRKCGLKIDIKECFNYRIPKNAKGISEAVKSLSWIYSNQIVSMDAVEVVLPVAGRFDKLAFKIPLNVKNV